VGNRDHRTNISLQSPLFSGQGIRIRFRKKFETNKDSGRAAMVGDEESQAEGGIEYM
jgi:hypothetical protein